jgi:hypothetical protein
MLSKSEQNGLADAGSRDIFGRSGWQSLLIYVLLLGGWMFGLLTMKPMHSWIHLLFILANLQLISRIVNLPSSTLRTIAGKPLGSVRSVIKITVSRVG